LPLLDDFSVDRARSSLEGLGRQTPIIQTAAGRQSDIGAWIEWLKARRAEHRLPRVEEEEKATQIA